VFPQGQGKSHPQTSLFPPPPGPVQPDKGTYRERDKGGDVNPSQGGDSVEGSVQVQDGDEGTTREQSCMDTTSRRSASGGSEEGAITANEAHVRGDVYKDEDGRLLLQSSGTVAEDRGSIKEGLVGDSCPVKGFDIAYPTGEGGRGRGGESGDSAETATVAALGRDRTSSLTVSAGGGEERERTWNEIGQWGTTHLSPIYTPISEVATKAAAAGIAGTGIEGMGRVADGMWGEKGVGYLMPSLVSLGESIVGPLRGLLGSVLREKEEGDLQRMVWRTSEGNGEEAEGKIDCVDGQLREMKGEGGSQRSSHGEISERESEQRVRDGKIAVQLRSTPTWASIGEDLAKNAEEEDVTGDDDEGDMEGEWEGDWEEGNWEGDWRNEEVEDRGEEVRAVKQSGVDTADGQESKEEDTQEGRDSKRGGGGGGRGGGRGGGGLFEAEMSESERETAESCTPMTPDCLECGAEGAGVGARAGSWSSRSDTDPVVVFKERWRQKERRLKAASEVGHLRCVSSRAVSCCVVR
jgi:hypothetical protein